MEAVGGLRANYQLSLTHEENEKRAAGCNYHLPLVAVERWR